MVLQSGWIEESGWPTHATIYQRGRILDSRTILEISPLYSPEWKVVPHPVCDAPPKWIDATRFWVLKRVFYRLPRETPHKRWCGPLLTVWKYPFSARWQLYTRTLDSEIKSCSPNVNFVFSDRGGSVRKLWPTAVSKNIPRESVRAHFFIHFVFHVFSFFRYPFFFSKWRYSKTSSVVFFFCSTFLFSREKVAIFDRAPLACTILWNKNWWENHLEWKQRTVGKRNWGVNRTNCIFFFSCFCARAFFDLKQRLTQKV